MAAEPALLRAILNLSVVPVLALGSLYFVVGRPRNAATWLMGAFLGIMATRTFAGGMVDVVGANTPAGAAWAATFADENYLSFLVFSVFGWFFPTPLAPTSWHGRAYLLVGGAQALLVLAFFGLRLHVVTPAPSDAIQTLLGYSSVGSILFVVASILIRASGLPTRERNAAGWVAVSAILSPWTSMSARFYNVARGAPVGANDLFVLGALAIALFLAIRRRSFFATWLIVEGTAVVIAQQIVGPDFSAFALVVALRAIVPIHVAQRTNLFELDPASRRVSRIAAFGVLGASFVMLNIVVVVVTNGNSLALAAGVFLGLVGGLTGASLILPPEDPFLSVFRRSDANAPSRDPALLLGRYRFVRDLGEGGQGRAQLFRDEKLRREVVVKRVPGASGEAAIREARTLAQVQHPGVIAVYDTEAMGGEGLIVMEYAAGGSLAGLLRRDGALGGRDAARMLEGVLDALAACHDAGIVHGDVKPANVLLVNGKTKLADFGVARPAIDATLVPGAGTLRYMAPEQARGDKPDARSDVYSAAVLLHELATGRWYLADESPAMALHAILTRAPTLALPAEAASLEPVLTKALAKDPAARYPDARAMLQALRESNAASVRFA